VKNDLILVRYGEIGLKAEYTRKQFENILIKNIKESLQSKNISFNIKKTRGRIYVYTDQIKTVCNILKKIFGIISVSPVAHTSSDMESMEKLAIEIANEILSENMSFALKVTRDGVHRFTSRDVAVNLGDSIVKKTGASVDLTNPDFTLNIEIREKDAYFYFDKIFGVGGLPRGSQGNVLAIINDETGILAAWYLMKRGCDTVFSLSNDSIRSLLEDFITNWHIKNLIYMAENNDTKKLRKIISDTQCNAVVTGCFNNDLRSIKKLKEETNLPVLTPLVSMSKNEVTQKCKKIGLTK
jgi:thiamine biosynthesis protein ThiI